RSAAYMARYIAKNLVAAGVCDKATIQLAYAIGVVEPVSILVDTHGTSYVDENRLEACVREFFRLTPRGIIESLDLLRPIYRQTAAYGHFGRELDTFSWEKRDKVSQIKDYFGLK
ncbi:MAG: methionine adenosyltransferase, partial [Sulfurospirillum sp.]